MRIILAVFGLSLLWSAAAIAEAIPYDPAKTSDAGAPNSLRIGSVTRPMTGARNWLPRAAVACDSESASFDGEITWTGQCVDKLLDGNGRLQIRENGHGSISLTGTFVRGVLEGPVSLRFANGVVFEGAFHAGQPNGPGAMRWPNGLVIEGGFHDDLPNGEMRIAYGDGDSAVRVYKDGVPDGPSTMDWMDVNTSVTYRAGRLEGAAVTTYRDGSRLEFNFKNDEADPVATFTDATGHRLVGAFIPSRIDPAQPPHSLSYPEDARRRDESGTVYVSIVIGENGHVKSALLSRSSGFVDLDNAALDAVRSWSYIAATVDGHPIPTIRMVPIPFILD